MWGKISIQCTIFCMSILLYFTLKKAVIYFVCCFSTLYLLSINIGMLVLFHFSQVWRNIPKNWKHSIISLQFLLQKFVCFNEKAYLHLQHDSSNLWFHWYCTKIFPIKFSIREDEMWLIIIHINNIYFNLQEIDILIRSSIVCGDISCYLSKYY